MNVKIEPQYLYKIDLDLHKFVNAKWKKKECSKVKENIKILTYNLWGAYKDKLKYPKYYNINIRGNGFIKLLNKFNPDVCCLQEVSKDWLKFLLKSEYIRKHYFITDINSNRVFMHYGLDNIFLTKIKLDNIVVYGLPSMQMDSFLTCNINGINLGTFQLHSGGGYADFKKGNDFFRYFKIISVNNKKIDDDGRYKTKASPDFAARKAFSQLTKKYKSNKLVFVIKETTKGYSKKEYGPYLGEKIKLKKPLTIKYKDQNGINKPILIKYETKVKLVKDDKENNCVYTDFRKLQLQTILNIFENDNFMITGDFNFTDGDEENKLLKKLKDPWNIKKNPGFTEDTYINKMRFNLKGKHKQVRFDKFMYNKNKIKVIKQNIIGKEEIKDGIWVSDHFGLITEIKI